MSERRIGLPRDPLIWLFVVTICVSIIGTYDLAREIGTPFPGYLSYRRSTSPTGEIDANTPVWWSGLIGNRLAKGDTLVAAAGRPYYPFAREAFAAGMQYRSASVIFRPPDGQGLFIRHMLNERFSMAHFTDIRLPEFITAVSFWLLAIVIYRADKTSPTHRAFVLICCLVALIRSLYVHNIFLDNTFSVLVELSLLMVTPALGVVMIYFTSTYPVPTRVSWRPFLIVASIAAVTFSLAAVLARWPGLPLDRTALFGDVNYYGTLALYLIGLFALLGRLALRVAGGRISRRERQSLLIVISGLLVALPVLLLSAFTCVVIGGDTLGYTVRGFDTRYLLMAVPLSFAYSMVRYRSMRAPPVLFIFVILLTFSAIVAAVGSWLWAVGQSNWPQSGLRPPFTTLFVAALVSSLFWGAAASARGAFGRIFHYDRRASASARNFGRRILGHTDLSSLPGSVTRGLVDELELVRAAIWLASQDGDSLTLAGPAGEFHGDIPETILVPAAAPKNANGRPSGHPSLPARIRT